MFNPEKNYVYPRPDGSLEWKADHLSNSDLVMALLEEHVHHEAANIQATIVCAEGVTLVNLRQQQFAHLPEYDYAKVYAEAKELGINDFCSQRHHQGDDRYRQLLATWGDFFRFQDMSSQEEVSGFLEQTQFFGPDILASILFDSELVHSEASKQSDESSHVRLRVPVAKTEGKQIVQLTLPLGDAAGIFYELLDTYQLKLLHILARFPDTFFATFLRYAVTRYMIEQPSMMHFRDPEGKTNFYHVTKKWATSFVHQKEPQETYTQEYHRGVQELLVFIEQHFKIKVLAILSYGSLLTKFPRLYPDGTVASDADFLIVNVPTKPQKGPFNLAAPGRFHLGSPRMANGQVVCGSFSSHYFTSRIPHADLHFYTPGELNHYFYDIKKQLQRAMPREGYTKSWCPAVYTPSTATLQAFLANQVEYGAVPYGNEDNMVKKEYLDAAMEAFFACTNWDENNPLESFG